ncbi:unnamed protein product [Mytilus edulis]|uniref:Uncharacterized protein n=1 Tax=Mytilus edulis TaxID=6550 RepID=A0A8S3V9I9_MYTED|nr:unnamed protein product [Mytilus edulis]
MNNFFCSLHLLVNFADVCAAALLKFENLHLKNTSENVTDDLDSFSNRSESGTVRLLRTSSKAFGRGVDEKSGVYSTCGWEQISWYNIKIVDSSTLEGYRKKPHILDMNDQLTSLRDFLKEAQDDATEVLEGNLSPFPDKIDNEDIVLRHLLKSDETDTLTIQILQTLFSSMLTLLERQACDHLPGGDIFKR